MSLDKDTVKNIAYLARMRVDDDKLEPLAVELSAIMGWIEQLQELNTDGVEPMASPGALTLPRRADEVTDGQCRDAVLRNAPDAEDGFFAVPKVVE